MKLLYSHYHYSGSFKRPKGPVVFSLSHIEKVFHAKILFVSLRLYFTFPLVPILSSRRREIMQAFPNKNTLHPFSRTNLQQMSSTFLDIGHMFSYSRMVSLLAKL